MIYSGGSTVILDACVLYPAPIRDLMLSMASEGLFKPKWTYIIQNEWVRSLLENRTDLKAEHLQQTIAAMNMAFPDSSVEDFEELIPGLKLPDENDRHVLASAIQCHADLIVTFNLKDFPNRYVDSYNIQVQSPDKFLSDLIDSDQETSCIAFRKMVGRLKNPPKSKSQVADTLLKCGLKISSEKLKNLC